LRGEPRGELELRCFCHKKALLAVAGRDAHGEPYVHVKVWKSVGRGQPPRLFAEVVATSGVVRLRCRECLRWHKVSIKRTAVDFRTEKLPAAISL
jgi:hypothetical protein